MKADRRIRKRRHARLSMLQEMDDDDQPQDCAGMKRRRLAAGVALVLTVLQQAAAFTVCAGPGTRQDSVTLRRERVEFDLWCSTMASTLFVRM